MYDRTFLLHLAGLVWGRGIVRNFKSSVSSHLIQVATSILHAYSLYSTTIASDGIIIKSH